jgi:dihydrofolate synthase/folylpolyglutamate synthase
MYLPHWPIPSTFGNAKIDYETVFERMSQVLQNLDNPHKKLPPIIHVTGTNGKGSVIAFLANILRAAGLKIHIYTSPHLHHCNERIILNGEKISDTELFETMEEARIGAAETPLTFFEGFTIGAFLAFAKNPTDLLIVECGMGGRIDATNIIENKIATIITPISFDHTEYLGNSIAKITFEKAHIIRPNTPVIIASQPKQALEMIEIIANDQQAKMIRYDQEFQIEMGEKGEFDYRFFDQEFLDLPTPSLLGEHQYINAATAISASFTLPFNIKIEHIRLALTNTYWQSRLEKISDKKDCEIFIDGAHNQAGAFALARWMESDKTKNNFIICGFTKNKCKKTFLENFIGIVDGGASVRVDGEPNPESAEIIAKIASEINLHLQPCDDLLEAVFYLKNTSLNVPCRIVICGSLHLARDVKKIL